MHIRYVEQTASDILSFKKMFEHQKDVFISACAGLGELGGRPSDPPIDLLLIDVMNPDGSSVEDDVRTARRYTSAPILFLTGAEAGAGCVRALAVGAASVVSKREISAEMIYRLLDSARNMASPSSEALAADEPASMESCAIFPGWDRAFHYLERGFDAQAKPGEAPAPPADIRAREWRRVLSYVREIGRRDQGASCECDAAALLAQSREDLIDFAAAHRVPLLIDVVSPASFFVVGSELDARLGLEAIVLGLVSSCAPGDRLRISLTPEDGDQATLSASTDGRLDLELGSFFAEAVTFAEDADFCSTALQCGAALLGLRREQCDLTGRERGEIKLRL